MAIIPVGLGAQHYGSGFRASSTVTATGNIQTGDAVFVLTGGVSGTVTSVTDGTNTYTKLDNGNSSGTLGELWWCSNAVAVASPTITVNYSPTMNWSVVAVMRVPGVSLKTPRLDQHTVAGRSVVNPSISLPNPTPSPALGIGAIVSNNSGVSAGSSGWTQGQTLTASSIGTDLEFINLTPPTMLTFQPTLSSSDTAVIFIVSLNVTGISGFNMPMLGM